MECSSDWLWLSMRTFRCRWRHGQIRAISVLHTQNIRMTIARHFGAHR